MQCVERFVPKISKKSKNRNPWITRGTLQLQRKLKRLKKKYKSSTNVQQQSAIDKISSELKLKISQDKDKYFGFSLQSLIKASPERFWKTITPTSCSPDMFVIDGKCVHNDEVGAAAFNDYFTSVFTMDNNVLPAFSMNLPPLSDVSISEPGILNLLLHFDIKKSPGPDDIPNSFLKRYAEWCAKYLYVVFTKSVNDGALPDDWRLAKIKPAHKTGGKTFIPNYRPLSLTSTSCKLLEHIIYKHVIIAARISGWFLDYYSASGNCS